MPRTGLSKEEIVEKAAELANEKGLSYLSVTTLSEYLGIRKPSLYNHMKTRGVIKND
ncbi:MAG: TetR family transcriptional regulator [Butyrivibrio sp.]|nr:TetR family transcriptional regulator [Butyrivibrio sp.]